MTIIATHRARARHGFVVVDVTGDHNRSACTLPRTFQQSPKLDIGREVRIARLRCPPAPGQRASAMASAR